MDPILLRAFQAPYPPVNLPWPPIPPFYSLDPVPQLLALRDPSTGQLPEPIRVCLHTGDFRVISQLGKTLDRFLQQRKQDVLSHCISLCYAAELHTPWTKY